MLYLKWVYKDIKKLVEGTKLLGWQCQKCKTIGLIVFEFTLHEEQVNAILCLFYEQTDLFLLAKTGFIKSIIFQLLLFMTAAP